MTKAKSSVQFKLKQWNTSIVFELILVAMMFGLYIVLQKTPFFGFIGITFVSIILEAFPFLLIGTIVSGLIEVFISKEQFTKWLPAHKYYPVFIGAALGLIFPVCECAIVPVVRRLLRKGVSVSAAIAFLLGGPIVNPLVAASTAVAYGFDWWIVGLRMMAGYAVAAGVGVILSNFLSPKTILLSQSKEYSDTCGCGCHHEHHKQSVKQKLNAAVQHAAGDFFDTARFLVIGAFLASLFQAVVSSQTLVATAVMNPAIAIIIMMIMAFVLNLCSEADAFVAASFQNTMVPLSAQLAFMILGPMLDIKLLLMYRSVFTRKAIVALAGLTALLVLIVSFCFEWLVL